MTTPQATGQQQLTSAASAANVRRFEIQQLIGQVYTIEPVEVLESTSSGELAIAGSVVIRLLTNQVAGDGTSMPHGPIYEIPYIRIQGGTTAFIIDPQPGDRGVAMIARSDISAVKAARGQANPGSFRRFNLSDSIYLGGLLNAQPTQYVRASADGLELVSPTLVRIQAPTIELQGAVDQSGGAVTVATDITAQGTITGVTDVIAATVSGKTHAHTGVTTGGGTSGPPVP